MKQRPQKGIRPHGSGIQIDFMFEGRRYREKLPIPPTTANLKHAVHVRNSILFEIASGQLDLAKYFPNRGSSIRPTGTIGDALTDFLRYKRVDCAHSTLRDYGSAIEHHLRPRFGSLRFDQITSSAVRAWLAELPISPKRKNNILIPLREVFKLAFQDGVIRSNPLERIENLRHQPEEPNPFTPTEINQLLQVCAGPVRNLFQFAFYTGLRTSELIALRWEDGYSGPT